MKRIIAAVLAALLILSLAACASGEEAQIQNGNGEQSVTYSYTEYPLERNGIDLHLDRIEASGGGQDKNILLIDRKSVV